MQCFGGCFAPVRDHDEAATAGTDVAALKQQRQQQPAGEQAPAGDTKASIKAKLRTALSAGGSKKQQQQPAAGSGSQVYVNQRYSASGIDREELRTQYLAKYGRHILGVSTLQQDEIDYFVMPGIGYIAYGMMYNGPEVLNIRTAVGLSDPVCDRKHFKTMAEAFLKQHPHAMFGQTSKEFAAVLHEFGFNCNSMGGETRMDLATYNFSGYARRGLRSAISGAQKEGIVIEEVMFPPTGSLGEGPAGKPATGTAGDTATWASLAAEMQAVDERWVNMKGGRANDVWFINRRPIFAAEPGVRKFVARSASGELLGFIFFDGVFEDGRLAGYYANVTRMSPEAHPGTLNLMVKHFIDKVRAEAQLAAPAKKLSISRSQRRKLEAAAAAAAAAEAAKAAGGEAAPDTAPVLDVSRAASAASAASLSRAASAVSAVSAASEGASVAAAAAPPAGPRFLSLGLSPFYQMDDSEFKHCKLTRLLMIICYVDGSGFYPFKTLAAAKAKYGAGLHNCKYEDPAVAYNQNYFCHRRLLTTGQANYDIAKFYGFWSSPYDLFVRYFAHKGKQSAALVKRGAKKLAAKRKKGRKGDMGSGRSASSACDSSTASGSAANLSTAASLKSAASLDSAAGGGAARQQQQQPKQKKQQPKKGGGTAAAAAGASAGAATSAAAAAGAGAAVPRPTSAASLIATAANPPGQAPSSTEASGSDSDAASTASAGNDVSRGRGAQQGSASASSSGGSSPARTP